MLMAEIRQNIFLNTKRPDQIASTDLAIKNAIQRLHNVAELVRDLKYATLTSTDDLNINQEFKVPSDYRKIFEVYRYNIGNSHLYGEGKFLKSDSSNVRINLQNKNPCFMIVGKSIFAFDLFPFDKIVIQYYQRCVLDVTHIQEDWIVNDYNELFTNLATSIMFANLRNYNAATIFMNQYNMAIPGFLANEVEDGNDTDSSRVDSIWVGNHG